MCLCALEPMVGAGPHTPSSCWPGCFIYTSLYLALVCLCLCYPHTGSQLDMLYPYCVVCHVDLCSILSKLCDILWCSTILMGNLGCFFSLLVSLIKNISKSLTQSSVYRDHIYLSPVHAPDGDLYRPCRLQCQS